MHAVDRHGNLEREPVEHPGAPFTFTLQQTGSAVTGTATYNAGSGPVTGTVSGTEQSDQFDVVITWSATSAGHYAATVTPGQMINGTTSEIGNPANSATWSATGPTGCSVPSSTDQCKNGGWNILTTAQGVPFNNQGDCVSYVVSAGKSDPHIS